MDNKEMVQRRLVGDLWCEYTADYCDRFDFAVIEKRNNKGLRIPFKFLSVESRSATVEKNERGNFDVSVAMNDGQIYKTERTKNQLHNYAVLENLVVCSIGEW